MQSKAHRQITILAILVSLGFLARAATAGPVIKIGKDVPANQRISMDQIDHRLWDQLLHEYVDDQGSVAYGPWKNHGGHVRALDAYLEILSTADPRLEASREAKLAYWINAYNAVTVRGILREFPTSSIRNHTAKVLGYNIWNDLQLIVGGSPISLDSIEHKVLRKMHEPRIHFAIVCASISCPRLLNEAYVTSRLERQLTDNTKAFFANAEKFKFDAARKTFRLSAILNWFKDDFGADQSQRLNTISDWLPGNAQAAAATGQGSVSYLDYDWGLNVRAEKPNKQLNAAVHEPQSSESGSGSKSEPSLGSGSGKRNR